jgi:predicted nucleic acid-binding protein
MYVLDTDVVSHLRRTDKAHPNVISWASSTPVTLHFISCITLHELERGILSIERKDAAQGAVLRAWMDEQILVRFSGRILPVDTAVAQRCAKLHVPNPKPERDAFIAATALVHGMSVVTRNVEDFRLSGVEVLNPWEWEGTRSGLRSRPRKRR